MENFKIISERENPLYDRKEVEFTVDAEITPSREEVKKFISKKFSCGLEASRTKGIYGGFGSKTFTIKVNIYKSEEDKKSIEPKSKRDQPIVEKEPEPEAAAPEPAAEAPAEAPVEQAEPAKEEVKEEAPAEEKEPEVPKEKEVKEEEAKE